MHRRSVLTAAAGFGALAFTPEVVLAAAANSGDWTLGVADVEADIAPQALRLVHGRAAAGLSGVLYRNGPAKFRRPGGSAEFDGWLVGTSINFAAKATELHVFDARRVAAGPICTWRADVALPATFHGTFVSRA